MSQTHNPFARGLQNLRFERKVCIVCADGQRVLRPLYPSQTYRPDDWIERVPCVFSDECAVITDQDAPDDIDPAILADLDEYFPAAGTAQNVVYAIIGDEDGEPVPVGDVDSEAAAREIVRRLSFETGHFNRCWEIGRAHLDAEAGRYLANLTDETAAGFLFSAFRIPHRRRRPAFGVKLITTPWTDGHLRFFESLSAQELRQQHRDAGVPDALADVLHLAARADVRLLIFDENAPILDGLPVYDAP